MPSQPGGKLPALQVQSVLVLQITGEPATHSPATVIFAYGGRAIATAVPPAWVQVQQHLRGLDLLVHI